jgi:uncharacterized protein YukE
MLNDNQIKDRINKSHGYIIEEIAKKTIHSGRKVIEGEVGVNGIDLLTYVEDKDGNLKNVRPYEIKYNKSPTGHTNSGAQGSTTWINNKMETLISAYKGTSSEQKYKDIYKYIKEHNPDTRLIRAKPIDDERIAIEMSTLISSDDTTQKVKKLDGRKPKLMGEYNLINPKTKYDHKVANVWKEASTKILKERFSFLDDKDITRLQKSISLKQDDIKEIQEEKNISQGGASMSECKIEISSENIESYLELVKQCKENILELNYDIHSRITSLQEDWDELGYEEFSDFFQEKVESRMELLVEEIIENQMIHKLNTQIEKHQEIENHKL